MTEINVRQLEIIFTVNANLQMINISTLYSYVENFGRIISCEESRNGLDIRMIEADDKSMDWVNRYHDIDGYRVLMRSEMYILDLPLFCLKEICKRLLKNSMDDLCSITEVNTTLTDAATLAFEEKFPKRSFSFTLKKQMQTDVRLLQCFRNSITRVEVHAEDAEHFTYILSSLKKIGPNVLKYLIFSNEPPECQTHFSQVLPADLEDLFSIFIHLEVLSVNTKEMVLLPFPPNLKILKFNFLYSSAHDLLRTFDTVNANLEKIIVTSLYIDSTSQIAQLLKSSKKVKEFTIYGWYWQYNDIGDIIRYVPQLEVLNIYTGIFCSTPSVENIQTLKIMPNLKILNIWLNMPSIELLNAINELNVVVECLIMFCRDWTYEFSVNINKFIHLKLLRIETTYPLEGLVELIGSLSQLSVLLLKKQAITLNNIKQIICSGSKLTDLQVGCIKVDQLEFAVSLVLDTKQYLEIVSAARRRPNELQLRIWWPKHLSTNIDSAVLFNNVKYVKVLLKNYKFKLFPPCGFTI